MRGRKAKPDGLKAAQGNPGKRKIKKPAAKELLQAESEPVGTAFTNGKRDDHFPPPEYMTAEEKVIWLREIGRIGSLNLLRQSDTSAFESYVYAIRRYEQAREVINRDGMTYTVESKHGTYTRKRPELDIERDCRRMIRDMQKEFGMTSVSRIRAHSVVAATRGGQADLPLQGGGPRKPEAGADGRAPPPRHSPLGMLKTAGSA